MQHYEQTIIIDAQFQHALLQDRTTRWCSKWNISTARSLVPAGFCDADAPKPSARCALIKGAFNNSNAFSRARSAQRTHASEPWRERNTITHENRTRKCGFTLELPSLHPRASARAPLISLQLAAPFSPFFARVQTHLKRLLRELPRRTFFLFFL